MSAPHAVAVFCSIGFANCSKYLRFQLFTQFYRVTQFLFTIICTIVLHATNLLAVLFSNQKSWSVPQHDQFWSEGFFQKDLDFIPAAAATALAPAAASQPASQCSQSPSQSVPLILVLKYRVGRRPWKFTGSQLFILISGCGPVFF